MANEQKPVSEDTRPTAELAVELDTHSIWHPEIAKSLRVAARRLRAQDEELDTLRAHRWHIRDLAEEIARLRDALEGAEMFIRSRTKGCFCERCCEGILSRLRAALTPPASGAQQTTVSSSTVAAPSGAPDWMARSVTKEKS